MDKGDIAVPLVFTKYSDVADVQHLAHHPQPRAKKAGGIAIETQPLPARTRLRRPARAVPRGQKMALLRPSCAKTSRRGECAPSPVASPGTSTTPPAPFITENPVPEGLQGLADPEEARPPWIPNPAHLHLHGCAPGRSWSPRPPRPTAVVSAEESAEQKKGRAAADSAQQAHQGGHAYKDVKPVKPIKAPSQYKPPTEETSLENQLQRHLQGEQERRRIRSLYSEPGKEPAKVRRCSPPNHQPTTTTSHTLTVCPPAPPLTAPDGLCNINHEGLWELN
uniref:Uncharacterized protein n=1 Tax=Salarias fasciatus TaxID=181472 RepID=A0A672FVN8_SALFA